MTDITSTVTLKYNPEGARHNAPWVITDGPLTVNAAGYGISAKLLAVLTPEQIDRISAMKSTGCTTHFEFAEIQLKDISGRVFVTIDLVSIPTDMLH